MSKRTRPNQQPTPPDNGVRNLIIQIIIAIIAATGLITVALINRSTAITISLKPIESTQTAEALHTSVAMTTQTAEALYTSIAMTTQTAEAFHASIAMTTQAAEAMETSIAVTKTAEAIETSVAMTKTAETLGTTIAMTNQAAKPPTNTPLPPSSYGGLTYGCIPTSYWQLNSDTNSEANNCWDLSKWGLYSDTQLFRIDIDNSNVIEKTLSMNISDFKDVDISFRLVVKDMRGNPEKTTPRLAIGVCEPNRPQFEHEFVYYDLSDNKLASAITINGFDNKDKYYFYNNEVRNYRLEVRSYDLSIYENGTLLNSPTTIKRTGNTSFCLYYLLPEGGSLHSVIDKLFVEKK